MIVIIMKHTPTLWRYQEFMEKHFPKHTPTLWRYQGKHELFFGAKWDDFWYIERMWAIYSQRVYRNPRPTHIDAVMRRLRDEVRNTDPNTPLISTGVC